MGDDTPKAGGGYPPWWAIDKAAWRERFTVFYQLRDLTYDRTKPLQPWTAHDVEEFIKTDPVHGPRLALTRQGAQITAGGAVAGGLTSAALCIRHSKSSLVGLLGFFGGAMLSSTIAEEGANFALGLYKFNYLDTNLKFLQWWQKKTEE